MRLLSTVDNKPIQDDNVREKSQLVFVWDNFFDIAYYYILI